MLPMDWAQIKYFKPTENWGDVSLMNFRFIKTLDKFREFLNTEMVITCGTQGQHQLDSFHYKGMAVDVVFPNCKLDLPDLFIESTRFAFTGIGVYPCWKYNDLIVGGLHLEQSLDYDSTRRLWLGLGFDKANTKYSPLNFSSLREYA